MIIARFGYEAFYVTSEKGFYTLADLSFEYGKELENQGTTGKAKPISYITSINLIKGGFKIHLDHRFVDIHEKRRVWKEMAEGNKLYAFSVGGVYVSDNKFTIKSLKESNIKVNGKGQWLSLDLDVSIEEYAGTQTELTVLKKRLADYS